MGIKGKQRNKFLHVRLSSEEHAVIADRARDAGVRVSDFIRSCGVQGKVCPVPSVNVQQWAQLAATTSNLNQLTRLANQGRVPPDIADAVQTAAHLLREIRTSLIGEN
jgi:uncharacterized protein (DUF1778 family)